MKRLALTAFSLRYPWLVLVIVLAVTAVFTIQFPKVRFDNDPENMLAEDEAVRVFHHQVKEKYALYDFVIAGVVNETHPDGIFNVDKAVGITSMAIPPPLLEPLIKTLKHFQWWAG